MSRRLEKAAHDTVRPNNPSRRLILGVAAAAPLVTLLKAPTGTDPAAEACEAWLARHAEHERLANRWQQIENYLFKEHDWSKLTRVQRNRFPETHEMDDLYDRMDVLHDENRKRLALLPTIVAATAAGIVGKLSVASAEVCPEENEDAHLLIVSILRDFRALTGA